MKRTLSVMVFLFLALPSLVFAAGSYPHEIHNAARLVREIISETSSFDVPPATGDYALAKALSQQFGEILKIKSDIASKQIGDGTPAVTCFGYGKTIAQYRINVLTYYAAYVDATQAGDTANAAAFSSVMYDYWNRANHYTNEFYREYADY